MKVFLILTIIVFIAFIIYHLKSNNAEKAAYFWDNTLLGEGGFHWIKVIKGSTKDNSVFAISVSLVIYLLCHILLSLIIALALKYLWFIIIPLVLFSKIIIKFKIKK